jgi:hypothetical protein
MFKQGLSKKITALFWFYYAGSNENLLQKFRYNLSLRLSGIQNPKERLFFQSYVYTGKSEDDTDRLSQNITNNYHHSLRNNAEGRSSNPLCDGSLKSGKDISMF